MARVLVTGGNGFIAIHVIEQLLARGHSVVTTVRSGEKTKYLHEKFSKHGENLKFRSSRTWLYLALLMTLSNPINSMQSFTPVLRSRSISKTRRLICWTLLFKEPRASCILSRISDHQFDALLSLQASLLL
ncbi:methylglyoxal reductase (NADPH-dependent) gre2 [Tulasnella sp. 418]|nr:methylglyoxal reductase (NADPH-dependent) gre2 [Tulasnella sp. 418]